LNDPEQADPLKPEPRASFDDIYASAIEAFKKGATSSIKNAFY
jgi:hypothetical protein